MRVLLIDNYDSFSYNLVQYFEELGCETRVFRNDSLELGELETLSPDRIVISPGPGMPTEAGICCRVARGKLASGRAVAACRG